MGQQNKFGVHRSSYFDSLPNAKICKKLVIGNLNLGTGKSAKQELAVFIGNRLDYIISSQVGTLHVIQRITLLN